MNGPSGKDDRKKRLAEQLRANLRRRKQQSRARAEEPGSDASGAASAREAQAASGAKERESG